MKKLVLVLMMALALVSVNAKQSVVAVTAKVDTAKVDTASAKGGETKDIEEFKQVMKALGESGILDKGKEIGGENHWDVVGFAAITSPFIAGFLIVLIILIFNHRNKKAKYELMAKAIDAGKEIPSTFFDEPKSKKANKSPLQSALSLIGIGIGLFIMLWFVANHNVAFVGALPLLIGVGKLIAYLIEGKKESKLIAKENDKTDDDQQVG